MGAIAKKGSLGCLFLNVSSAICRASLYKLKSDYVLRLGTFLALGNGELDLLAFSQSLETAALNGAVVNENVRAAFASNKTKTFCFVEKLNVAGNCRHSILS